ncbi:hypothetical protein DFH06DRAFT_1191419 [Mycena polygramma]|nr:hypothetical protein DFH06DRAFT_1191419 [Mycena polygramma]
MSPYRWVLTPTQSRTIQDPANETGNVPLKTQTSCSLPCNLNLPDDSPTVSHVAQVPRSSENDLAHENAPLTPQTSWSVSCNAPDSPNVSRAAEDATLCYVPKSSENDLTACVSTFSGFKMTSSLSALPSSLELLLRDLPEIPDLFEDQQLFKTEAEPVPAVPLAVLDTPVSVFYTPASDLYTPASGFYTPVLDTPQSDYHSLENYDPTSFCGQNVWPQLAEARCTNGTMPASPGPWSFKYEPEPPHTATAPSRGRPPIARPIRRSYSFDIADRRAAYVVCSVSSYLYPAIAYDLVDPTRCRLGLWSWIALFPVPYFFSH